MRDFQLKVAMVAPPIAHQDNLEICMHTQLHAGASPQSGEQHRAHLLSHQQQMQQQMQQQQQLALAHGLPQPPLILHQQSIGQPQPLFGQSGQLQQQTSPYPPPPSSVQSYVASRFRKSPAVVLTGSPMRPKPRPPPPPPVAVKYEETHTDLDDEPSFISELIRGAMTPAASNISPQDPYGTFFDDIKGWEEDVSDDDLVMKLLNATGSVSYKYLTVGDSLCASGAVSSNSVGGITAGGSVSRADEERPPVPPSSAASRRQPVRKKPVGSRGPVPILRATLEDMGEESSTQSTGNYGSGADIRRGSLRSNSAAVHRGADRGTTNNNAFGANVGAEDDPLDASEASRDFGSNGSWIHNAQVVRQQTLTQSQARTFDHASDQSNTAISGMRSDQDEQSGASRRMPASEGGDRAAAEIAYNDADGRSVSQKFTDGNSDHTQPGSGLGMPDSSVEPALSFDRAIDSSWASTSATRSVQQSQSHRSIIAAGSDSQKLSRQHSAPGLHGSWSSRPASQPAPTSSASHSAVSQQDQYHMHIRMETEYDFRTASKNTRCSDGSTDMPTQSESTEILARDQRPRTRPSTSRKDLFDMYRPDSIVSPATERMALFRKKLISSAASAKVHWRSSRAAGGSGNKLMADPLSLTMITGRKYHKNDPLDRHGHMDDGMSGTRRRPQTASAALCEFDRQSRDERDGMGTDSSNGSGANSNGGHATGCNNGNRVDKTMLPRIGSQTSGTHIVPGESDLNPVVRGFGSTSISVPSLTSIGTTQNGHDDDVHQCNGNGAGDMVGREHMGFSSATAATVSSGSSLAGPTTTSRMGASLSSDQQKAGLVSGSSGSSMLMSDGTVWNHELSLSAHMSASQERPIEAHSRSTRQQSRSSASKRTLGATGSAGSGSKCTIQSVTLGKLGTSDSRLMRVQVAIPSGGIIVKGSGSNIPSNIIGEPITRARLRPSTSFPDAAGSHMHTTSMRPRRDIDNSTLNDLNASSETGLNLRITKAPQNGPNGIKTPFRSFRDQVEFNRGGLGSSHRSHAT